uniref:TAXi_C domain-containing protein n=1 Tax=Angiostrongylus cantonensis TaxID=6313 RepID=A0A0K0D420_ANGCA
MMLRFLAINQKLQKGIWVEMWYFWDCENARYDIIVREAGSSILLDAEASPSLSIERSPRNDTSKGALWAKLRLGHLCITLDQTVCISMQYGSLRLSSTIGLPSLNRMTKSSGLITSRLGAVQFSIPH